MSKPPPQDRAGDGRTRPRRDLLARLGHAAGYCLLTVCALASPSRAAVARELPADVPLEYAVKATYLYKLAPFVNWPPDTFASPDAAFNICVVGRDPFGGYLEKAIAGHKLGTHPLRVQRVADDPGSADCQIAFIGAVHAHAMHEALQAFAGKPVLTVADSRAADSTGSIVRFVIVAGRVRFDIDGAAAQRNHLTISSKLLGLALSVRQTGS